MHISENFHRDLKMQLAQLKTDRYPWWKFWRELADYILPRRYLWLMTDKEAKVDHLRNRYILDPTGTQAAKTLASGMMNGITSPSRPWFRLRIAGLADDGSGPEREWLDEVQRRMLRVMAESNFYNAMAVMYLDLVVFATAATLIYEDDDEVIRCYNNALGEYYLSIGSDLKVNGFAREFKMNLRQMVQRFGEENLSEQMRAEWRLGGSRILQTRHIVHMIEPADREETPIPGSWAYHEYYWDQNAPLGQLLSMGGFNEMPGIFPRWETTGNDAYGVGPGMDALPDIVQLQHETKAKGQSLDFMLRPPMLADISMEHRPTALLPRGVTFIAGLSQGHVGAKPAYQVTPPLAELTLDIRDVQGRIQEAFHNDLFKMISQLDTVRSATEIDARREEKLVLLGPVLERFENEALDPAIKRIYAIMGRKDLLPPMPPSLQDAELEIQYVSVLSDAQRAVGTISIERGVQFVGNLAAVRPDVLDIPNWEELTRDYFEALGVPAKNVNDRQKTAALKEQRAAQEQMQQAAQIADPLTKAAKQLSDAQVGGGANALSAILGG